ncbi:hypothetical protein DMB42_11700 [Nonomuraea sp. WAC 01424]|uniref:hypothetical protein n=1 Tax=Nonomuraea sp. WAC 01424 TaxID=2203200 RepID=UPI000F79E34B|nr:hypothetical protein [Nonomuraea sp. WAC 01424]RSN12835.1 hypothetical protein DMB42_11700 [Nonomuraea sp. WAC 01424]
MADRIPLHPIQEPPYSAIQYEPGTMSAPANEEALREALSGVELGAYDEAILKWMTLWETATVATVCSWLYRVREVDRG